MGRLMIFGGWEGRFSLVGLILRDVVGVVRGDWMFSDYSLSWTR
jgi:hypothetical protein